MKAVRPVFVIMLVLSVFTYGQSNTFYKVRYNGGAVQTEVKSDDWSNRLAVTSEGIKLDLKDGQQILIDPKRVTGLGYGQEAQRRVGATAPGFISPGALLGLFKARLHYISIEFTTPQGKKSALLIQGRYDNYRAVLTALRGVTGALVAVSEEDLKFVPGGAPAEGATGAVKVTSQPEGADIWVDSALVGNAPAQLKLAPGKHRILVLKEGYRNWEKVVTVVAGSVLMINASMKK